MAPIRKVKPKKEEVKEEEQKPVTPVKNRVISGQLSKKLKKIQKKQFKKQRGVVFIKHLPHGFFEDQLQQYFEQFGRVTRLRLVRSRRTGGSKGFAFVEFEYPEVAQVAAETMDNYLMFQKLVKAAYIPPEKQLYNYFKSAVRQVKNKAGKTIFVSNKTAEIRKKAKEHNNWTADKLQQRSNSNMQKIKNLNKKYAHLGIDFSSIFLDPKSVKLDSSVEEVEPEAKAHGKKAEIALADLLGNTLQEDSDDEEWTGSEEELSDVDDTVIDDDNDVDDDDDDDDESEDEAVKMALKQQKKIKKKPALAGDRLDKIIKRKPQAGGVQKSAPKGAKKSAKATLPQVINTKSSVLLAAAKEVAKPLAKTKKGLANKKKGLKKVK